MSNEKSEASDDSPSDSPSSPAGSPPTASLSSLMELENCVSNLSLAHEIIVNQDFCFKPKSKIPDRRENDLMNFGQLINRCLHMFGFSFSSFWDCLQEQLSSDPPDYSLAVLLLQKVKAMLLSLLLPAQVRLRSQLDEGLDMELIQQEVNHGALDLHRIAGFVISTMGSLCAPVRDPEVKALRVLQQPVELLRETFRVLELMRIDMANFSLQTLRPHLLPQAAQYERAKFQQILEKYPDSLDHTTAWLQAAASEEMSARGNPPHPGPFSVLNRAYIRLLYWDPHNHKYPESVLMDRARLDSLAQRIQTLVLETSVLLLTSTHCGGALPPLQGFVGKLKQSVTALLEDSQSSESELKEALVGLAETVLQQLNEALSANRGATLPQETQNLLRGQISDLWMKNNAVRILVGERVQGFLWATLQGGSTKSHPELPAALRLMSSELTELGTAFGRIVQFNQTVYGPFYQPILRKLLFSPGHAANAEGSR
ncbi:T-complex protein 11-like protein 1 isoform X1 [Gouania willdenowi]|uniref:T-complex protein 11-like protein 1 isoform X1 n=1 Tax=Gouania willdenowi TaxID=441366 RepID=UPI001054823D|nr:T-complex protein 11-like protein 1 isoform X1 [Gouania willdenowi]XP_028302436.1 T-complex protein 11-like protein 1 isoform X1 [Gouania willdenowi]XP_028302437.1 T-complex protein 11-like protein 1 isoform X1 [Gouania willdenowi]XP_028302438.1 T-complex protein 11-like protein 1 isoform X1 [Gouania willdenowi]